MDTTATAPPADGTLLFSDHPPAPNRVTFLTFRSFQFWQSLIPSRLYYRWEGSAWQSPLRFDIARWMSYSHRDTVWAKWLHKALEDYRIDKDLVGRETIAGPVPKTLRPIFRDREDFSGGSTLTAATVRR